MTSPQAAPAAETPLEIRYTATRRDVATLFGHQLRRSARFRTMLFGCSAFVAAMQLWGRSAAPGPLTVRDWAVVIAWGVGVLVVVPVLAILGTKKAERRLTAGPDGIATSVGKSSGQVPWTKVERIEETPDYIFVVGRSQNGFTIPARAFSTPAHRTTFVRAITHWHEAARGAGNLG